MKKLLRNYTDLLLQSTDLIREVCAFIQITKILINFLDNLKIYVLLCSYIYFHPISHFSL